MKMFTLPKRTRQHFLLVTTDEWRRLSRWMAWTILVAAVINVAFSVSKLATLRHRVRESGYLSKDGDRPRNWLIATPHDEPWPSPAYSNVWRGFGTTFFDGQTSNKENPKAKFSMDAHLTGWPLSVLGQQYIYWDWDNPALKGPKHNPTVRLMPLGLILNPIIIGGGGYALLFSPLIAFVLGRRFERLRHGLCVRCGYDVRGIEGEACPECGS